MNNTVLLPTDLTAYMASLNTSRVNAVVQLVVYAEDGLEVLLPETNLTISKRNVLQNGQSSNLSVNYSVSF